VTIVHHPDDATLLSYAGGSLDEVFTTLIAAHLASCPDCRRRVRALEAVGGSLLESASGVELSAGAAGRILERLELDNVAPAPSRQLASMADSPLSTALARLIGGSLNDIRWKKVAPGVATHRLPVSSGSKGSLMLLKIAPGKKVPEHGHGGMEMTLILEGSYRDVLGRFGPGDVADLDEHVEHQPVVDSHVPCVCLVATEQPTRFKGFFSRLLQPLVGI
jgi:putative transcriptional regulator